MSPRIRAILIRRLVLLALLAAAIVLAVRPDWRRAAQRAAAPVVERVLAFRQESRRAEAPPPRRVEPPAPAEEPAPQPEETPPAEEPETPDAPTPEGDEEEGTPAEEEPDSETREDEGPVEPAGNLPPRLPEIRPDPPLPAALKALQDAARARPTANAFRRLADAAGEGGFPSIAADAYLKEAEIYRRQGDPNAAAAEERKAGRFRSEGQLFLHAREPQPSSVLERLEPPSGALLGAFIDRDERIRGSYQDENWQTHRDEKEFARLTGKRHASLFCYLKSGKPFPTKWAERLRDAEIIPHIAWEPDSLSEVTEASLAPFADALARFDAPIFIRFAGEMNGDWTRYHGDPALYRQKFRLVHRVISRRAPKAALIWCVNSVPDSTIDAYYPGDDAVDWVGVNLYSVLYFDNLRSRPADKVHPVDLVQAVYRRYADRKPIALCEYAASHQAAIDPRPRPEFAIRRLSQMYAALPRLFPRVKLIDWFNCNNLKHARPDRQLNNYSVTDDPGILGAYREAISPDYFLTGLDDRPAAVIRPLREAEALRGIVTLSSWVRAHLDGPRVYILADDKVLYAGATPGAAVCRWDTSQVSPGRHEIRLIVLDDGNRKIVEERKVVRVVR